MYFALTVIQIEAFQVAQWVKNPPVMQEMPEINPWA